MDKQREIFEKLANKWTVVNQTTEYYEIKLSADELKQLLGVPENARVYFSVPGGGDWSNADIDISDDDPVMVTWNVVK